MTTIIETSTSLVGKSFDCAFGDFVPRITVLSPTELRVQATIGVTDIDEIVTGDVKDVRPGVVIMSWTEQSGNFIVQVQDHQNGLVHNYARLADGQLFCAQGVIEPVALI